MVYIVGNKIGRKLRRSSRKNFSEAQLMNAQDKVIAGYAKKLALDEKGKEHLHRFFSPWRIPKGMTKGEVRMIIFLMENHSELMRQDKKRTGYSQTMTRSGFLKMINEIIHEHLDEITIEGPSET